MSIKDLLPGYKIVSRRIVEGRAPTKKWLTSHEAAREVRMDYRKFWYHLKHGHVDGAEMVEKDNNGRAGWRIPSPVVLRLPGSTGRRGRKGKRW